MSDCHFVATNKNSLKKNPLTVAKGKPKHKEQSASSGGEGKKGKKMVRC
jgi:hypothetical protein